MYSSQQSPRRLPEVASLLIMQIRQLASRATALMVFLGLGQVIAGSPIVRPPYTFCSLCTVPTRGTRITGGYNARDTRKPLVIRMTI